MKLTRKRKINEDEEETEDKPPEGENFEEMMKWYDKQIEKNPKDTGLYYAKSALLAKEGKYEESLTTLDRIIELDPTNKKVWHIKAYTLFELQRYGEAVECYDILLKFIEDDERVWFHKGEALTKLERFDEAIKCYDMAIRLYSNFTEAWLGRGNALRKIHNVIAEELLETIDEKRKSELEDALKSYTRVNDLNPYSEQGWHGKGNVLYDLTRFKEALPCFDKCIEINPNFIKGWYDRGKVLLKLDRKSEASQSFKTVVGFSLDDPNIKDAENLCTRANAFFELGCYKEALKCFDDILKRYPGNHYALAGKGAMLENLDRKEEAMQCYTEAIEMNSSNPYYIYKRGELLSELGNDNEALECYDRALSLTPEFKDTWIKKGELLGKLKGREDLDGSYLMNSEIHPDNEGSRRALKILATENEMIKNQDNNDQFLKRDEPSSAKENYKIIKPSFNSIKIISEDAPEYIPMAITSNDDEIILDEKDLDIGGDMMEENTEPEGALNTVYENMDNDLDELLMLLDHTVHNQIDEFQNAPQVDEKVSLEWLVIIGRKHLEKQEFEKALSYIDKALELDPQFLDAWVAKGEVFIEMSKFERFGPMKNKNIDWKHPLLIFLEHVCKDTRIASVLNFECPECGSNLNLDGKKFPKLKY